MSPTPQPTETPGPADPATGLKPGATEIVDKRTESSQTYDNHDGTYSTVLSSAPEFYQPAGSTDWQPITLGFAKGAKTDDLTGSVPLVTSAQAPAAVSLFNLTSKDFVTVTDKTQSIGFALPLDAAKAAQPTTPVVDGVSADYPGIQPDVDLRIIARTMGSKAFLILHSLPANPSYTFRVDAPGLTLVPQKDGSINLVDASGAAVAAIPHPYALDSTNDSLSGGGRYTDQASVVVGKDNDGAPTITISVDPSWLKTATFPVYVDPSVQYLSTNNTFDAHTASAFPSANYHAYQRPDSPFYYEMWLGTDPSGTSGTSYDFISWDPSSIAGVTVDSSSVSTHPYHQYYSSPTVERSWIGIPTASWTEAGITWSNQPSAGANITFIDGVEGSTTASNPSSLLDAAVQGWIDGTTPNRGIRIWENGNGSTYWKRLIASEDSTNTSWRPTLTINYHIPVTTVYPIGGGPTSDTTLTWTADGSWAAGSHYQVDVATNSSFSPVLWSSGDVTSSADKAVIGTALTPGTTYYWRVKVRDASGIWTSVSATASFVYDLGNLGGQSQSTFESFDLGSGDDASVNVSTGNLLLTHSIVTLPIRGSSLSISLAYNSQDPNSVGMGPGWRLNVQRRLALNADGTITFIDSDDARYTFTSPVTVGTVTTYTRPVALFATLKKDTSQTIEFTLTYRDQSRDTFDIVGSEGLLTRSEDRHGNGVTVAYVSGTNRIDTITDTAGGRTINFAYDGSLRISSITDWAYLDGSGVVQTTATGTRRSTKFTYDSSGNLQSWADPLYTSGSCTTIVSHLTCLTYGSTLTISKYQTVEAIISSALSTTHQTDTTQISLVGGEVTAVKDAVQFAASGPATTFARAASEMILVRPGTPSTTTTYGYVAATDPYARIQSVWRLYGSTNIEDRTVYDTTFPTLPSTDTQNYGALLATPARTTTTTYATGSLGLVARTVEPLTTSPATNRQADYTYNVNNDLVQSLLSQDGSGTLTTTTRSCYDSGCTLTSTGLDLLGQIENYASGGPQNADTNVTTNYTYDSYGQRLTEIRHNRDVTGATRDNRVTAFTYDSLGDQTSQNINYVNGFNTTDPYDLAPDPATGARTDLTTTYGFDTAGDQISATDPRRGITSATGVDDYVSRSTYNALGELLTQTLPTTPGISSCSPDPGCRQTSSTYDEFGLVRQAMTYANGSGIALEDGTEYDQDGRPTRTFEDVDGSVTTNPAVATGKTIYDAAGRAIDAYDRVQVGSSAAGYTLSAYDALGRTTDVTEASASSPNVASVTHSVSDALSRVTQTITGFGGSDPQTTTMGYDLGGRVSTTNDGFTCQTQTFDYLDRTTSETDGLDTSCGTVSGQTVTITDSIDGVGRTYRQQITGGPNTNDRPQDDTFDAVGNRLSAGTRVGATTPTTTFTVNLLDQALSEGRPDGTTAKTNYDPVGSVTDACTWNTGVTVGACLPVGTIPWTNPPSQATTTVSDARDQRISLTDSVSSSTTTYDPAAGYQVSAVYVPTAIGKEFQSTYQYNAQNRLQTINTQYCVISSGHSCSSSIDTGDDTYAYDPNGNRTEVSEKTGFGGTTTDYFYCYDARNELTARGTGSTCTSPTETNTYDVSGNRTQSVASGTTTNFQYNSSGQLCRVNGTNCSTGGTSVAYDSTGRISAYGTWSYSYDSESHLVTACDTATCPSTGNRIDFSYDGQGHRTEIKTTSSTGAVATTDFTYQGDAIVAEKLTDAGHAAGAIVRTYTVDASGAIQKVTVAAGEPGAGTYLVTWNGHGDALNLEQVQADGSLKLANAYTYSSWGTPTTATYNSIPDLAFRFLYVGEGGVQWDNQFGLGIEHMQSRDYLPVLGRFTQPDPARADGSLYTYASDSPISVTDPSGQCGWLLATEEGGPPFWIATGLCFGILALILASAGPLQRLTAALIARTLAQLRRLSRVDAHCAVIGEDMVRVRIYASFWGCDTYNGVNLSRWDPQFMESSAARTRIYLNDNKRWLVRMMSERRIIIDIGPSLTGDITRVAYLMEYVMTVGYPGVIRWWMDRGAGSGFRGK